MATWTKKFNKEFFESLLQLQLDKYNITVAEVKELDEAGFYSSKGTFWFHYYTQTTKKQEEWKEKCWIKCKEIGMPKKYFEKFFTSLSFNYGLKIQDDDSTGS